MSTVLLAVKSFVEDVRSYLSNLFARFKREDTQRIPAKLETKQEKPKPRSQNKEKLSNFSELLDHLEHTFEALKLPTMTESWLDKDSVIGLHKLGVHVPNPWNLLWSEKGLCVDVTKPLPSLMCIGSASKYLVNTDKCAYPKILFAVKHKKTPWYVSYKPGVVYQFGMAFDLDEKLFWVHMFITVNRKTGEISFCDELRIKANVIPIKTSSARRSGRPNTVKFKTWQTAQFLEDDMKTLEENRLIVRNFFVGMHDWWSARDNRWNVVVKKNGERVTFGVNNDQTPYYFKDRDKSIKTASGLTKKIIHYVKEHERKVGDKTTTVKEHIRGLSEFDWLGYHCKVVSPKLVAPTSSGFTAASVEADDDSTEPQNMVYLSKLGLLLARAEEKRA